jgi:hypothetical protein
VGTALEDTVRFTMRDGAILLFESGCYDGSLDDLEYCGEYSGNSSPLLRDFAALCLNKGMHVQDANGREVTHDSLAVDELTPRPQWAGINPQDFAKTVKTYMVPTRRNIEAYLARAH